MCSLTASTEIVMTDVKHQEVFEDLLATVKGHKKTSDTDMARYRRETTPDGTVQGGRADKRRGEDNIRELTRQSLADSLRPCLSTERLWRKLHGVQYIDDAPPASTPSG